MTNQTKLSILAAIGILLAILAGAGLSTEVLQNQVDTLVADITMAPSAIATGAHTPVVVTVVVTASDPSVTPEQMTSEPGPTSTPYAGCDVTVRGNWNDFVTLYGGNSFSPNTMIILDTVASGVTLHVDRLWIIKDVDEEYSYIPERSGWIRNGPFFPVYDQMECWALPSNTIYKPTFTAPAATPGPSPTAVPVECKVTPKNDYANVRSGPGVQYTVVGRLDRDKTATYLSATGEWYRVRLTNGVTGYIAGWVLEKSASCG